MIQHEETESAAAKASAPSLPPRASGEVHLQYTRRLEERAAERDLLARMDHALGNGRLFTFAAGCVMAGLAYGAHLFSFWWLAAPVGVFLALVVRHDRVIRRRERAERAVAFYTRGLERLEDRWAGRGTAGARFSDPSHPYSEDLDLFGRGSLFELLCTARTRGGEDCLAAWLRVPADPETIRARQAAVVDLKPRLDLREQMAILGEEVRDGIAPDRLATWGAEPVLLTSRPARIAAALLAALTVTTLIGWGMGWGLLPFALTPRLTFALMLLIEQAINSLWRRRVNHVVHAVESPAHDLELLSLLLARIESERFESPLLQRLRADLDTEGVAPSAQIKRLQTLFAYLEAREINLLAPVWIVLLWTTQFAFAIEQWRSHTGPHLADWLRVIGEFEALCALAGYAYEHPEDPFPEIVDGGARFQADALAHPLLPAAKVVRNSIRFDAETRLYIVSGSNMSGKSTLLRTLGTNTVLALAGAPVRAQSLRLTPLHLGASIRTLDSLQGGISRFYAEITRLRQIVDIADAQPPLLFLLDEILHGTNSHDRRVGGEAVVRALIARGAIGLITTHDLALARIAEDPALHATNVHFEDQMENGRMTFDYHLRPGVVAKSNAIELMRAVGLEV
jgi:hypothetical protein